MMGGVGKPRPEAYFLLLSYSPALLPAITAKPAFLFVSFSFRLRILSNLWFNA